MSKLSIVLQLYVKIISCFVLCLSGTFVQASEFHSDAKKSKYIQYTFVKNDTPSNLLQRLGLEPVFKPNGSMIHFMNLNSHLKKANDKALAVGIKVYLPITKVPPIQPENIQDWFVVDNQLFFKQSTLFDSTKPTSPPPVQQSLANSHKKLSSPLNNRISTKQAQGYNKQLNLSKLNNKDLRKPTQRWHKKLTETPKRVHVTPAVQNKKPRPLHFKTRTRNQHNLQSIKIDNLHTKNLNHRNLAGIINQCPKKQYDLRQTILKIPVTPNTPLCYPVKSLGLLPQDQQGYQKQMSLEIPLYEQQPYPSLTQRDLQAVNKTTTKVKIDSGWSFAAKALTATREYTITDANSQKGKIGVDPGFGIAVNANYQYHWLNLNLDGSFQPEKFKQDSIIPIQQKTDTRIHLQLTQMFSWLGLEWGLGMGLQSVPSFASVDSGLQAKHLNNIYGVGSVGQSFRWGQNFPARWQLAYLQFMGAEDSLYKLEAGYQTNLQLNNSYILSENFHLTGDIQFYYQDDKPTTYDQSQLGLQMLFGVQWLFGNRANQ